MANAIQATTKQLIPAMQIRAAFEPKSVDLEARTVDLVWTTGAKVLRGYYDQFYEELSMDPKHIRMNRLNNGAPFLADHDSYRIASVYGVIVPGSAKIEGKKGVATVRFAKAEDDPEADRTFRKIADGILQNVSVGYRVYKYESTQRVDEKSIPTRTATDWEPFEVSAVACGADDNAGYRSAKIDQNECEFLDNNLELREMPEAITTNTNAEANAEQIRTANQQGAAAERARISAIQTAVRSALQQLGSNGAVIRSGLTDEQRTEIETAAINNGQTIDEVRAVILEKLVSVDQSRSIDGANRVELQQDEADKVTRGVGAWLINKAGLTSQMHRAVEVNKSNPAATLQTFERDPGEFRGMTLLDLARFCLERAGVRTRGMHKTQIASAALSMRTGGMHSVSDFPNLLENTMHKILLGAYAVTPDTWSQFCLVGSVSDFRPHKRNRMGSFNRLEKLSEHGEFKNKQIPDSEKESISAGTLGNIIALTREAIVNDDMDAFSRLATWLGRAAKLSIEMDVYDLIASNSGLGPLMDSDGQTLFHASHSNITTSAAISTDALDKDRVAMASQKDVSKNEILDLRPSILIVPIGLGGEANVINDSQFDNDGSKFQKPNKVRGLFRKIIDTARLSGTRRYLLADPSVAPTFEVVFLDGVQEPYMDSREGFRTDGVEWKVRMDYGVDAVDWRGAVTNAGV